jgi:hypothetical protein
MNRAISIRLPSEIKTAIDTHLKEVNKGRRGQNRTTFNEWITGAAKSKLERSTQPQAHVPEVAAQVHQVLSKTRPWLDEGKLKTARTPAEIAAAIPGLHVGLPFDEEEGW